jgi:hypothetical protein
MGKPFNITCGCFWNDFGFSVSSSYLTVYNAPMNFRRRIKLTDSLIGDLIMIKIKYELNDANRTLAVVHLAVMGKNLGC